MARSHRRPDLGMLLLASLRLHYCGGFAFPPLDTVQHHPPRIASPKSQIIVPLTERQHQHVRRRSKLSSSSESSSASSPQHKTGGEREKGPAESSAVAATPKSRAAQEGEMFDWLAENSGVRKKVSLDFLKRGGYRGLVAHCDVPKGEVLLEVPSEVCLWSTRDGVVSGLHGQTDICWEAAGDLREPVSDADFARGLTWDVRLALALMEATADMQVGGKFWSFYGRLLPPPHTITIPFCLPERLLAQLHNEGVAMRARKQVDRLRSLFPFLMQTLLSHPQTAGYAKGGGTAGATEESDIAPMALTWAFAMVRSRAFAAENDRFAFVPFLDMANHDFVPSANFTFEEPGVFRLRAMRDIGAGEEATISYGQQLDAEQLMVQYGFPAPLNLPLARPLLDPRSLQDRIAATADEKCGESTAEGRGVTEQKQNDDEWGEAQRRALMDELFLRGQQRFARDADGNNQEFEIMVRQALPLISAIATTIGDLRGDGGAEEGARTFLKEVQAYQSANFPSTEEQDKELLSYCVGEGKVDSRLADIIRYRIGRKEAHTLAVKLLEEYLAPQQLPVADTGGL